MKARRAACIAAGLPPESSETKTEQPEAMEEDAPGLSMAEVEAKFAVTQSEKMAEQQVILDSIREEAEVEANRRLIRQRQAEVVALLDELDTEIEAEDAAVEQPEGPELRQAAIYPPEGTEIVDISDEE
ncbi:hypothetical protein D1007_18423 [Hordeum vulgare]|nr:hypothetical protein D1007_18423 [Hordeum vulgare]